MILSVIGHGYVGLVTACVFADLGNTVWVLGRDSSKIEKLKKGIPPFYEPGLKEIIERNNKAGRLKFTLDYKDAIANSEVVFIAVGTPSAKTGSADLSSVFEVAKNIGRNLKNYTVVATKSTVPPGTNKKVKSIIEKYKPSSINFDIASTPEFLSQGTALENTLHPDRIVIGTEGPRAQELLVKLHKPINGELVLTNIETAEMIKYAANSMLATRISFANTIAMLCDRLNADALKVLEAVGLDTRIGKKFLSPGVGFGGSCLPKDSKALIKIGEEVGFKVSLIKAVYEVNEEAKKDFILKIKKLLGNVRGKTIGVLGLSFKPDTDDMRDAPSIDIIKKLVSLGAKIRAYDPVSMDNAKKFFGDIHFSPDPYDVCKNSDILLILTEWREFKELDLLKVKSLLKNPVILDGRNIYNREDLEKIGFKYQGVGV